MKRTWLDLEPQSIRAAIELWHILGSDEFISRTRFRESRQYVVFDRGQAIASKPLVAMAFQLQFECGKDDPPRLSGGEETRAILDRLGYQLVDTHEETLKGPPRVSEVVTGPTTNFWWANQTANFDPAYADGTLWAPWRDRRGQQVDHWRTLHGAVPGDLVIHYSSPEIRGLSRVATTSQPAYPPRGYDDVPADTKGTLVLTESIHKLRIPRDLALSVLNPGLGPVTAKGTLRNGYFFPLDTKSGLKLLGMGGLEVASEAVKNDGMWAEWHNRFQGVTTGAWATVAIRAEQQFLRNQQLRRWGSSCALCGQCLPNELLVAAHIKPRWACSEDERMDTLNVSMLACLFGCDALFELGYIAVGDDGIIEGGVRGFDKVNERVTAVLGRRCPAHDNKSRRYFAWHRRHHAARLRPPAN